MILPITHFSDTFAKKFSHFEIFVPIFCRVHLEPAKEQETTVTSHFPFCTVYGYWLQRLYQTLHVQGQPLGFDTKYLALVDRNMQVRFSLKVVWES